MKKIDVKIGNKEEAFWTNVKEKTEIEIEALERALKFNKAILEMANFKIETEKLN